MFLSYHNEGHREFGKRPVLPHPRKRWTFQLTTKGVCSLTIREGTRVREEPVSASHIAVTGPDFVHGYGGRITDKCEIVVLHFDEADQALRSTIGPDGYRVLKLNTGEVASVRRCYDRCAAANREAGVAPDKGRLEAGLSAPLVYGIAALELTLIVLQNLPRGELSPISNFAEHKISEALAWYDANLDRGPTIGEVAAAVHLSPSHLRRLFHKVRGTSPQETFSRMQFERAKWLMRDPSVTLERVAESSGFGSGSAFSRAFKEAYGLTPKAFRDR